MKRVDDTEAKQAMLDALAKYTGPITDGLEPRVETRTKKICKLSEFGECQREFIPGKKWGEFCCTQHRKRWHYLDRTRTPYREVEAVEDARHASVNGHATNGHDVAKPKLTLADLGVAPAQPTTQSFKRRKLNNTQDTKQEERA
jgi:hypothetical protein